MRGRMLWGLVVFTLLLPVGPLRTFQPTAAATVTVDFSTYDTKDVVDQMEWDIFSQELRLSHSGGNFAFDPQLHFDAQGNIYLTTVDNINTSEGRTFLLQPFDPRGNRLLPQPEPLLVGFDQADHALAADGSSLLVWSRYETATNSEIIYVQKYDTNFQPLWNAPKIVAVTGGRSKNLQLALGTDGSAYVTWLEDNGPLLAQRLTADGSAAWSAPLEIVPFDQGKHQPDATIGIDLQSNLLLAWRDQVWGGPPIARIRAVKISTQGSKLWGPVTVDAGSGMEVWSMPPIFVDAQGSSYLGWLGKIEGQKTTGYLQKLSPGGARAWTDNLEINNVQPDAQVDALLLALDSQGRPSLAWEESRRWLYVQKFTPQGSPLWSQPTLIVGDQNDNGINQSHLASGPDERLAIIWSSSGYPGLAGSMQKLDPNGHPLWRVPVRVRDGSGISGQNHMRVLPDPRDGGVVGVWSDTRVPGKTTIYAQKWSTAGERQWPTDHEIASLAYSSENFAGLVTAAGPDGYAIGWGRWMDRDFDLFLQTFTLDMQPKWQTPLHIQPPSSLEIFAPFDLALTEQGEILLAYGAQNPTTHDGFIRARLYSSGGGQQWDREVQKGTMDERTNDLNQPIISQNTQGGYYVGWTMGYRPEGSDEPYGPEYYLYIQRLNSSGQKQWSQPLQVGFSGDEDFEILYDLAPASDGSLWVFWNQENQRDGDVEHYLIQRITPDKQRVWAQDLLLDSSQESGARYRVELVNDSQSGIWAAWQVGDTSIGEPFIRANHIDLNGSLRWTTPLTALTRSDFGPNFNDLSAAPGLQDSLYLGFENLYEDDDTGIARLLSDGVRAWVEPVYDAENFYLSPGVAQSRRVVEATQPIRSARLDADYTLNGGQMRFFLTSSGGEDWQPVEPGQEIIFATPGSDLRWRVEMQANADSSQTPHLTRLTISYTHDGPITPTPTTPTATTPPPTDPTPTLTLEPTEQPGVDINVYFPVVNR